jgi:hypothetical protein
MRRHVSDDDARLLQAAVRRRVAVAAADLALPDDLRLTDWQRTTVSALLAKVVRTVEDELRTNIMEGLGDGDDPLHAALSSAHVAIAMPILLRAEILSDPSLIATLLRRTEEHRQFRSRQSGEGGLLIELIRDEDPAVAEQAMAIVIGQSRRFDSFGEPSAARTELPAELEHRLVWRVAAALRLYMIERHEIAPAAADALAVPAAERLLASYDEGDGLESRCMRLVRHLHARGRLDDGFAQRALAEVSLPLLVATLAVRASLSYASAWEILSDPRGRGPVLLLKSGGGARAAAASILLALGSSEEAVAAQVDLFDILHDEEARDALKLWQVNTGYREAVAELSSAAQTADAA